MIARPNFCEAAAIIAVSVGPGLTMLTRMPFGASSLAHVRVNERTPAFVAPSDSIAPWCLYRPQWSQSAQSRLTGLHEVDGFPCCEYEDRTFKPNVRSK